MGRNGFAVIDLETTGLSNQDRIVEIGVVLLRPDFSVERTWETLIQPERDIPNSYIHKITATDVVDAPLFRDVAPYLGSLLNGRTLVAHNASFEHRFLTNEFARAGAEDGLCEWLDTMRLTKQYMGVGKLSEALGIAKIRNRFAHSALADAEATAELLRYLCVGNGVDVEKYPAATFTSPAAEAPCLPRGGEPSWAGQLSRTLPTATTKNEADYRAKLTCALVDRAISRTEMRRLESTATAAGLSTDDVDAINEEFTRQLAVEAWADGVITDEERATLLDIAEALNVDAQLVRSLLDEPTSGPTPATFALRPGDRVAFTGALDIPRDVWTDRATAALDSIRAMEHSTVTPDGTVFLETDDGFRWYTYAGGPKNTAYLATLGDINNIGPALTDPAQRVGYASLRLLPGVLPEQATERITWWNSLPENKRPLPKVSTDALWGLKFADALRPDWAAYTLGRRLTSE